MRSADAPRFQQSGEPRESIATPWTITVRWFSERIRWSWKVPARCGVGSLAQMENHGPIARSFEDSFSDIGCKFERMNPDGLFHYVDRKLCVENAEDRDHDGQL